jgi:agmatinase
VTWPLNADPGAFLGIAQHGRTPDFGRDRFAVLPIPYDLTATWQKGTVRGPEAILDASHYLETYDPLTRLEPIEAGVVTMQPVDVAGSAEEMCARVKEAALSLIDAGKTVVGLGGEHSVSIGLIQAHAERYPGLTVLQLDAHGDSREELQGSRFNHGCVMARAREVAKIVQVGIRSMDAGEVPGIDPARIFYAHDIRRGSDFVPAVADVVSGPVYLTVDLDVFDPAYVPATGTPEPGGLDWWQIVDVIGAVSRKHRIVGFDVVELMPVANARASDFLAARLVLQIMAFILAAERAQIHA